MSTAARKARKRAGIRFEKPAKVGTPVAFRRATIEREWAHIDRMEKDGLLSKQEWRRAGAAIDKGKAWMTAVPRIRRNNRRAQKGGN